MKLITKNRRALFDYSFESTITAGMSLRGDEVKSIRNGQISLKGSYARIKNNELWLLNTHISKYSHSPANDSYDPLRTRKLLVTKKELSKIKNAIDDKKQIIPISVLAGRHIKVELGIGKARKKYDKRQVIKKRDIERNIKYNSSP